MSPKEKKVLAFATFLIAAGCYAEYWYGGIAAKASDALQQNAETAVANSNERAGQANKAAAEAQERAAKANLDLANLEMPRGARFFPKLDDITSAIARRIGDPRDSRTEILVGASPLTSESGHFAALLEAAISNARLWTKPTNISSFVGGPFSGVRVICSTGHNKSCEIASVIISALKAAGIDVDVQERGPDADQIIVAVGEKPLPPPYTHAP